MKKVALALFTTAILVVVAYFLGLVHSKIAMEFQRTYSSFGMAVPEVTRLFLLSIPYWKYMVVMVAFLSYAPIILTDGKLKYLCIAIPALFVLSILACLYLPVLLHGPVV